MENKKIFLLVIGVLVLGTIGLFFLQSSSTPTGPGKYDTFATCLKDSGTVFYGAFWCPHCQAQKKLFGSSARLLPYVECSTADANGQNQICKDKNIAGYPTWMLKDGTIIPNDSTEGSGVKLETLAAKTSCVLPQ
jgi:thiol-disulfide isomerase/thioredoxin